MAESVLFLVNCAHLCRRSGQVLEPKAGKHEKCVYLACHADNFRLAPGRADRHAVEQMISWRHFLQASIVREARSRKAQMLMTWLGLREPPLGLPMDGRPGRSLGSTWRIFVSRKRENFVLFAGEVILFPLLPRSCAHTRAMSTGRSHFRPRGFRLMKKCLARAAAFDSLGRALFSSCPLAAVCLLFPTKVPRPRLAPMTLLPPPGPQMHAHKCTRTRKPECALIDRPASDRASERIK